MDARYKPHTTAVENFQVGVQFSRKNGYGGVVILHNEHFITEQLHFIEKSSIEGHMEITGIIMSGQRAVIIDVYRSPDGTVDAFFAGLKACLELADSGLNYDEVYIAGDFNIDLLKTPKTVQIFCT